MNIPILDANVNTFSDIWPSLLIAVKLSSFIALDCELSGLGNRMQLNAKCINDRYAFISNIAKSRSIIAVGVSCFKFIQNSCKTLKNDCCKYFVQTFNLTVLCDEDYTVEPASLKFLVHHGFDFQKQYSLGLPYYRGNDKEEQEKTKPSVRMFLIELLKAKKPLVFHNGFIDLIFLYQNFYADLPSTLQSFIADICEMFSSGIYDTKYLSEYISRMKASYLEYVFGKLLYENVDKKQNDKVHIVIQFPSYEIQPYYLEYRQVILSDVISSSGDICQSFAFHGWCNKGEKCTKSHNINDVLLNEKMTNNKRKRKLSNSLTSERCQVQNKHNSGHRAGYDAFMTGFILCCLLLKHGDVSTREMFPDIKSGKIKSFINKIYLSGKDDPLLLQPSNFSKLSKQHKIKHARIANSL